MGTDKIIAQYNIEQFIDNKTPNLDLEYIVTELSYDAIPTILSYGPDLLTQE
jgi:hypothetical protein